jgi:hypothetical protein
MNSTQLFRLECPRAPRLRESAGRGILRGLRGHAGRPAERLDQLHRRDGGDSRAGDEVARRAGFRSLRSALDGRRVLPHAERRGFHIEAAEIGSILAPVSENPVTGANAIAISVHSRRESRDGAEARGERCCRSYFERRSSDR